MRQISQPRRDFRLAAIAIAPAVPIVVLGLILSAHTRAWTTERATTNAADAAGLVADFAISPLLDEDDFATTEVDQRRVDELDATLQPIIGDEIVRIKIWDATGRIVYSDNRDSIGATYPISHELEDALQGEISSEVSELDKAENTTEQDFDRLLEVYVPVRAGQDGEFDGAFELYLPYNPIAESIESDTRRIFVMLADTPPVTRCSRRWPVGCGAHCEAMSCSPVSAATSSLCSSLISATEPPRPRSPSV